MVNISKRNPGKIFESDFIRSVPDYCWHKRLNDNAASWGKGDNTRFTSTNECDFLLFDCNTRTLNALELKTTSGSLTYWREDFETDGKKNKFQIKQNQILGLQKWSKYFMNCGLVLNFRNKSNHTYFVAIEDFIEYTSYLNKKSINENDVLEMNPIKIENKLLRIHYSYDLDRFLRETRL